MRFQFIPGRRLLAPEKNPAPGVPVRVKLAVLGVRPGRNNIAHRKFASQPPLFIFEPIMVPVIALVKNDEKTYLVFLQGL